MAHPPSMQGALALLFAPSIEPATSPASLLDWWAVHRGVTAGVLPAIDKAICAGFRADRPAYAFASGYQEALKILVPSLPEADLLSLCATESQGAHPAQIATHIRPSLDGSYVLRGDKRWATCSPVANKLLVIASSGRADDGRNRLHLVVVGAPSPGVEITPMPPTPFAPEIPHAQVRFSDVVVPPLAVLTGDGYADYLKPFRTLEDTYVVGALLGLLLGVARRSRWPEPAVEELAVLAFSIRSIAASDPAAPGAHLALAGVLSSLHRFLDTQEPLWDTVDPATRQWWERDRPLLHVASNAREQRRAAAWRAVSSSG